MADPAAEPAAATPGPAAAPPADPAAVDPAPRYALIAGGALILTGAAGYLLSEKASPVTALIPAIPGAILITCGVCARRGLTALKIAMHVAALIGLLGFLAAVGALVARWSGEFGLAQAVQTAMAVICGVFLVLCVKSFRDARKRREAT